MIVVDFYATPHSCSRFAFLPILGPLLSKSVWSEISLNLPIWRKKVVKYVSIEMTQNGRENTKTRLLLVQHLKRTGKWDDFYSNRSTVLLLSPSSQLIMKSSMRTLYHYYTRTAVIMAYLWGVKSACAVVTERPPHLPRWRVFREPYRSTVGARVQWDGWFCMRSRGHHHGLPVRREVGL